MKYLSVFIISCLYILTANMLNYPIKQVIQEDGKLSNIAVHFGRTETLNREALRVVSKMPDWKPGKMRGKIVSTRYILPIKFSLVE